MTRLSSTPDFTKVVRVFARIGLLSFGGPAGQIALMHRELVEDRGWIEEQDFLHALNFCHLLPGPEAQQLATYIGWKLHGVRGGLAAGLLFVVPGALVMLGLSALYVVAAQATWFTGLFLGIKAAVLAIIAQALMRIAGRALDTPVKMAIAAAAFILLVAWAVPFPLLVLGAGFLGAGIAIRRPDLLGLKPEFGTARLSRPPVQATLFTVAGWMVVWALPLGLVWLLLGPEHVLWKIGLFFSQLAVVTFGGAYAVLAYMAQQAVQGFGWLSAGEMADGLGLAETTPGPLILVTQFVGFLAAWRAPGVLSPIVSALLGAGLTIWVTFVPCFLWIFSFAPWIDRLRSARRLRGSLAAITASIVGVIGSLALWFATHLLWPGKADGAGLSQLTLAGFDGRAAGIAVLAAVLLFRLKWSVIAVLAVCAGAGFLLS